MRVAAYQVDLDLTAARDSGQFTSTTTVLFSCTDPGAETFVELRSVSIVEARLNGTPIDPPATESPWCFPASTNPTSRRGTA